MKVRKKVKQEEKKVKKEAAKAEPTVAATSDASRPITASKKEVRPATM